jgi:simple sugar transport system ATP-binding protein
MTLAVEMRRISKRFAGILANDQVDFQLAAGEIHALLGENGAGKTTLMQILSGLYRPDIGEIFLQEHQVHLANPGMAIAHGIGMVHQHFMLIPVMTVTENILLGYEKTRYGPFLRLRQAEQRIRALAEQHHLEVDPQALVHGLPVGLQQRVEILKALYRQARVLILDEPTAVLTPTEIEHLFHTLVTMAHQGTAIVFITHKLREVLHIAHRITVLRRGRVIASTTPDQTTEAELAALMVGRAVPHPMVKAPAPSGAEVLRVQDLQVYDERGVMAVDRVSFMVRAGEIFGIAGVQGNGQTELVEAVTGLRPIQAGKITMQGSDITHVPVRQRFTQGMGHIPEDRHKHGMVASETVANNLVLNTYTQQPFARGLTRYQEAITRHARHLAQEFDIRTPSVFTQAGSLSGGNQQKLVVARECSRSLTVLIAAQPTRGLDIGASAFVQQRLLQQRAQGCAVLLVSTELDEIFTLADRLAVMYRGHLGTPMDTRAVTPQEIGTWLTGLQH